MNSANPVALARRRYVIQFSVAMVAYCVVLFASVYSIGRFELVGTARYLASLAPLVPVAFLAAAVMRYVRDTDEFERRVLTEAMAIGGGVTALLAATYGFLEIAGLPQPSAWWTWTVLMFTTLIARLMLDRRYR
jgi:hypothetical protein